MIETIESEYTEPKTHSIVSTDCELRSGHVGKPVSYKGVEGWLIRYIPDSCVLMELTLTEVMDCLNENATDTDSSI
jgi:hypothetical protein